MQNRQWKLRARPVGMVQASDFELATAPLPSPGPGEALVEVHYVSVDPAMRGWLNDAKSYVPPVGLGEVMRAGGIGRVLTSNDPSLAVGDTVTGLTNVQQYAVGPAKAWTKVDPTLVPEPRWIGLFGITGLTAYFGLLDIGQPKAGETLVVSAAAGAVGAVTGQIGKLKGLRVVGIAGGAEKCRYVVEELGFDACIDYKGGDVRAGLKEHCPQGVDIYFDNVGGEILDLVLTKIRRHARIVLCGAISQYNEPVMQGPKNYMALLVHRARMEGFVVFDYAARYGEAVKEMAGWLQQGTLKAREDIVDGIEQFPAALLKLFRGENNGKMVLKVAD